MPKRIQRKRTRGWTMPPNTVYVGRPTAWGNHWHIGDADPDSGHPMTGPEVLIRFEEDARIMALTDPAWLAPLLNKDLACWCSLDSPCHADILLRLLAAIYAESAAPVPA